jgi:endonuclease I
MVSLRSMVFAGRLVSLLAWVHAVAAFGQTAPAPQQLPYFQGFGTAAFSSLPAGVAAWNGVNGGSVNTQALAEASVPSGNSQVSTATSGQTTGGCYGYATDGNARFYIQTSSNATNGVNQLAIAINTTGWKHVMLGYDVEVIKAEPRSIGVICQYRIGNSGTWSSLVPAAGNPFSQTGGEAGVKASVSLQLPADAENRANVQIRWAIWRGAESGNSSGLAIDNLSASGQLEYGPPPGYYAAAEGHTGASLKDALQGISATGHVPILYGATYNPLRAIHEDPSNGSNVITVYSGTSIGKNAVYYSPDVGLDADATWSREHLWPVSYGLNPGGLEGPAYSDLFNLRPAIHSINTLRGNLYFDNSSGTISVPELAPLCSYDSSSWQPRDTEKGDLARIMFYMHARYDGSDAGTIDLELANTPSSPTAGGRFARLSTLLLWHQQDPVSEEERRIHQLTASYQENRNPFVDRPDFVPLMWGNILLDKTAATVTEGGAGDSYSIALTSEPEADVTIQISATPAGQVALSSASPTFTRQNWNQPQTITLTAIDDSVHENTASVTLSHGIFTTDPWFASLALDPVIVTVIDDDPFIPPAPLPLHFGGPWSPLPGVGFLGEGLGTPYATSLGGDTHEGSAKFDDSGDRLTIAFDSAPANLTCHLKANTSGNSVPSQGVFRILQSTDGENFTLVREFINKNTADEALSEALDPSSRFVRFIYQQKVSGNIQLDKLAVSALPALTPWQAWQLFHGLSGPEAQPGADPDADGYDNLSEYALGRSPVAADVAEFAPEFVKTAGKLRIAAVIRVSDPALASTAETTTDLTDPTSWSETGVTRSAAADQSGVPEGFERTVFEIDDSGADRRFARLRFGL